MLQHGSVGVHTSLGTLLFRRGPVVTTSASEMRKSDEYQTMAEAKAPVVVWEGWGHYVVDSRRTAMYCIN